jgi:hypothetical protein
MSTTVRRGEGGGGSGETRVEEGCEGDCGQTIGCRRRRALCEVRLVVGWLVSKRVGLVSPHLVGSADSSCFGLSPLTPAPLDMLIDQ